MTQILFIIGLAAITSSSMAQAQNQPSAPLKYGESIRLDQAEKIMAISLQEATKNNWAMAIVIVDTGGKLVLFKKMDDTQLGSIDVTISKATTAVNFKRSTKAFEDIVSGGGQGLRLLSVPGAIALEGGEPIVWKGKIIGAIGVSGAKSSEDGQVARAGLGAIN
ncbi:MAG: heme-binding protein [Bacteroidetes bacterium]|nr:heme-binding protein [Bacteroidota bacterium]